MSTLAFDTVLHEALALPSDQRSFLATQLIASLDEDDAENLTPEWNQEIKSRMERARLHPSERVSHDQIMADARALLSSTSSGNGA
jgi:putative addiction module component (TIGR02574 family)